MLPALLIAAGCAAWHADAAGYYPGVVESLGARTVETWIEVDKDDRLSGRYVLHEATRDVPGTLEPLGDDGCGVALFRWHDLYGTGLVRLRFLPAQRCFHGAWGLDRINPALTWTTCTQAPVTS